MSLTPVSKTRVTVYTMRFEGLFGRNRKSKVHYGRQIVADDNLSIEQLSNMAQKELVEIGAKKGTAVVLKYTDVEKSDYSENGRIISTLIMPIFGGVPVLKLAV